MSMHGRNHCFKAIPHNRIGLFCYKCGRDDFDGNPRALSSHVQYYKPTKTSTRENTQVVLHVFSTDPFSFLVRKRKEASNSLHIIEPKQKEVCLNQDTPNKFLASSGDHVNEHVNEHESHQELNRSTIQESVSLPFDPDGPIPLNFKFQLDLLDVLSKHQADLKLHNDIISVIKSHSNDQRLTFSTMI
jgi:hypothetical protein